MGKQRALAQEVILLPGILGAAVGTDAADGPLENAAVMDHGQDAFEYAYDEDHDDRSVNQHICRTGDQV